MRIHGVCLVSGANRGIGLEITKALLDNPNVIRVYAGSRNADATEALRQLPDPQEKLRLIQLDITKDWSIKDAFEAVKKDSGKLNVLINNSAILETDGQAGIPNGERVAWLRHFDVNTVSHAMMIQEMLPLLQKSVASDETATIVNISGLKGSIESFTGNFAAIHGNLAYMCSKTAVNMLTKTVSLAFPDILTISICPGWNRTSMGGPSGLKDPSETAPRLIGTVDKMTMEHTGQFWNRKGEKIPY